MAEEILAIAVHCALKYADDFEKGMIAAVNHDEDNDSTGVVAGNTLGAAMGFDAIPQKFLDKLELKDFILEVIEDLHRDCRISEIGSVDRSWERKYLEMVYRKNS